MSATPFEQIANLDRRVHDPARLAILTALAACERADFLFLQRITGLTKGNLSSHLSKLEEAGLVEIEKRFVEKKTQTLVRLSDAGRPAIESYWKEMDTLRKTASRWRPKEIVHAVLAALAVLGSLCAAVPGWAAEAPRRLALGPCTEPHMPAEARCGTYEVFEKRAARKGRKIPLRILVLPATGADRQPDPFVYFAGGPGDASIPEGLAVARRLSYLRRKRDILLVDLRGTGESGGLFCAELKGKEEVQGFLDDFLPSAKVRACRDRLERQVDLAWYTTDAAVDDVEDVRTALGYGQLNLMGISYGTRVVLTYLRRHPASVRTAVLDGVLAPDAHSPLGMARATQEALDGLIAECAGDASCHGAFPKLRQDVDTVLRAVAAKPVRVELAGPAGGPPSTLTLTRSGVAQTLRYMLYWPADSARLPLEVHLAAQGDWKPLARTARSCGGMMSSMSEGFFLSVTCAEDVAWIRDGEIAPAVAGTFLGDFRVRRQKAACEGWPTRKLGNNLQAPVVSNVPTLLIAGERDPATPSAGAERVARSLKRARLVVIPDAGHGTDGMQGASCISRMITSLIESGTTAGLETSCLDRMRRPDFVLSYGGASLPAVKVATADLERLPGSYASEETNMALKVELVQDRLRLSVLQGPPFPPSWLIPTSPTRFRWEGEGLAPGLTVAFQVTGGRATALTVIQPGKGEMEMKRSK